MFDFGLFIVLIVISEIPNPIYEQLARPLVTAKSDLQTGQNFLKKATEFSFLILFMLDEDPFERSSLRKVRFFQRRWLINNNLTSFLAFSLVNKHCFY
jgi:hypothetical protein